MGINSEVKAQKIFRNIGYKGLALVSLLLGAIGVVLPGLPTVPFILLAVNKICLVQHLGSMLYFIM